MEATPDPILASGHHASRILVISLAGIGDTLMATPLLSELRRRYPEASIEALVLWKGSAELLRDNPNLNHVHVHNFISQPRISSLIQVLLLRRRRFDLSINTHPQGRTGYRWIAWGIHATRRLSHAYENHCWLDNGLVTDLLPQDYSIPCSMNNLRLLDLLNHTADAKMMERPTPLNYSPPNVSEAPAYELYLNSEERAWATGFIQQYRLQSVRWLGVHFGSGGTKNLALRRWPLDHYQALFQRLLQEVPGLRIIAFGGPDEQVAHQTLRQHFSSDQFIIAETPSLRHAAALLPRAHAFLSVDTAFMHLAAWARVPHQVILETPTFTPSVYPPRNEFILVPNPAIGGRHLDYYRYDGRPIAGTAEALDRLMRQITPESVMNQLLPLGLGFHVG